MITFPNAKINLGLQITGQRPNGYHTLETIFYPIPLRDALEIVNLDESVKNAEITENNIIPQFVQTGIKINTPKNDNLVIKAYNLITSQKTISPIKIYLKKTIPFGAGLGGGSADAAFMLKLLNEFCKLDFTISELEKMAAQIGADCPFFIKNKPVLAKGIGDEFTDINLSLKGYEICIIKPPVSISTKEAYANVKPHKSDFSLTELQTLPVNKWKSILKNDFEDSVFAKYPIISDIKEYLYAKGAEYAAMSGSGSAVFGLFKETNSPNLSDCPIKNFSECFVWKRMINV